MDGGDYIVHFDMKMSADGNRREVTPGAARLPARDLEICMRQALQSMVVPSFVLEQVLSASNRGQTPGQARHLVGDVTVATSAAMEEVLVTLEPIVVRAGPVGVAVVVTLAVVAAAINFAEKKMTKRCQEQWDNAIRNCLEWLSMPNPPRNMTGGHTDPKLCAKGHVDKDCGGNRLDGGKGARSGTRN